MADRRRQRRPSNPYQGLGILIAFALIIVFIASFWQVIIGCLIGAFVVYVVWRFREEICQGIAAFFRFIIRLFSGPITASMMRIQGHVKTPPPKTPHHPSS